MWSAPTRINFPRGHRKNLGWSVSEIQFGTKTVTPRVIDEQKWDLRHPGYMKNDL